MAMRFAWRVVLSCSVGSHLPACPAQPSTPANDTILAGGKGSPRLAAPKNTSSRPCRHASRCPVQYTAVPQTVGAPLRPVTVRDTIGDLPPIENGHDADEMDYPGPPVRPCLPPWVFFLYSPPLPASLA
jgi:hypothetical protein